MPLPRIILAALASLTLGALLAVVLALLDGRQDSDPTDPAAREYAGLSRTAAIDVLADWDRRRATAWAAGDEDRLADLYLAGSRAGRRDLAMLAGWEARGLRVRGLQMQVVGVDVQRLTESLIVVEVTDRVTGASAVAASGAAVPLPEDAPSTRVVTLRRGADEQWRVGQVRAVASTASTSGS